MIANDKINMAIVGLVFGRYIVEDQILRGPGASWIQIAGVCDLDRELASTMADRHDLCIYENLDEILADPKIEAVGLFTGPSGRAGLIRKILRAGKHVMTTKPFELDADAALSVLSEARELNLVVHMNSPGPLIDAESRQIRNWAMEFDLGRPVSFHWETHANTYEKADGSWYDDPVRCPVSPIFRLGIYAINQFIRLYGDVVELSAHSSRIRTGRPTPDNALLALRFENGLMGSIHASFCVNNGYPYADDLIVNYERGTMRSQAIAKDKYGTTKKRLWLEGPGASGEQLLVEACFGRDEKVGGYDWQSFHRAVRGERPIDEEIDPGQIAAGIRVIAAMARAEKSRRNIQIVAPSHGIKSDPSPVDRYLV